MRRDARDAVHQQMRWPGPIASHGHCEALGLVCFMTWQSCISLLTSKWRDRDIWMPYQAVQFCTLSNTCVVDGNRIGCVGCPRPCPNHPPGRCPCSFFSLTTNRKCEITHPTLCDEEGNDIQGYMPYVACWAHMSPTRRGYLFREGQSCCLSYRRSFFSPFHC